MVNTIIKGLAVLVCIAFLFNGGQWLIAPADAAKGLGMPLLSDLGLSTQIGDLSAFFITAGAFGLWGITSGNRTLMYTPMALVGLAAVFRTVAWLAHGAAATPIIGVELVMFVILLVAARKLPHSS